jgi:hypothetical protein
VYDYVPVSGVTPAGGTETAGLGYCGPINCGADCGCSDGNCAGGDCASGNCTSGCAAGDCGCGGCDGSCGCGPGNCNCGSGSCGCGGMGSGSYAYGGGCGPCDAGCGSCDYGCGCGPCDDYCDCGVAYECAPQCCAPKCRFWGEYLYLQSTDADVAHAQQQNGTGGAGTVPFGEIGTIGEGFNSGYRAGGSIACGPCTSVGVAYTFFESGSRSSLDAPFVPGGGGAVGSLVHHPGAALTASAGPVDASYQLDFQLADIAWRRVFHQTERYAAAFSAGFEYGHLEQDFAQSGVFGGGLGGAIDTSTEIDFDGAGISIGVDGDHQFGHGCGIYGRLTAAGMTGRFSSDYLMFNNSTDETLAQANWKDDRVIGRIEYELGASLTSMNNHWRVAAGYMFSYWTNVVTTPAFIDAVKADNYTNVGDTIGFNGLVGRVECMW